MLTTVFYCDDLQLDTSEDYGKTSSGDCELVYTSEGSVTDMLMDISSRWCVMTAQFCSPVQTGKVVGSPCSLTAMTTCDCKCDDFNGYFAGFC